MANASCLQPSLAFYEVTPSRNRFPLLFVLCARAQKTSKQCIVSSRSLLYLPLQGVKHKAHSFMALCSLSKLLHIPKLLSSFFSLPSPQLPTPPKNGYIHRRLTPLESTPLLFHHRNAYQHQQQQQQQYQRPPRRKKCLQHP